MKFNILFTFIVFIYGCQSNKQISIIENLHKNYYTNSSKIDTVIDGYFNDKYIEIKDSLIKYESFYYYKFIKTINLNSNNKPYKISFATQEPDQDTIETNVIAVVVTKTDSVVILNKFINNYIQLKINLNNKYKKIKYRKNIKRIKDNNS